MSESARRTNASIAVVGVLLLLAFLAGRSSVNTGESVAAGTPTSLAPPALQPAPTTTTTEPVETTTTSEAATTTTTMARSPIATAGPTTAPPPTSATTATPTTASPVVDCGQGEVTQFPELVNDPALTQGPDRWQYRLSTRIESTVDKTIVMTELTYRAIFADGFEETVVVELPGNEIAPNTDVVYDSPVFEHTEPLTEIRGRSMAYYSNGDPQNCSQRLVQG